MHFVILRSHKFYPSKLVIEFQHLKGHLATKEQFQREIVIATLSYWVKNLVLVCQQMRCKTNCTMYVQLFLHFEKVTSSC